MPRLTGLYLCLLLTSAAAFSQPAQNPREFWSAPGLVIRDAAGKIVYKEIKDPASFTMRVLKDGNWLTYRYEPNTTKIAEIDAPDTVDSYLYDTNGEWTGLKIAFRHKNFTIHSLRDSVSSPGMAPLTAVRDALGRIQSWSRGGEPVTSIEYGADGMVRRVTIGGDLTLDLETKGGAVTEVLRGRDRVLATATPGKRNSQREFRFSLDPVARQIGVGSDWSNQVRSQHSATGSAAALVGSNGVAVAYMAEFGAMRVGFDASGTPLFYDVPLETSDTVSPLHGADAAPDPNVVFSGVLPTRLVVTAAGDVAAYVERPADGALQMIGRNQSSLSEKYVFRTFNPAASSASKHAGKAPESVSQTVWADLSPNMMMICDSSIVCTSGDCGGCNSCTTTYYWCDYGSSGGYSGDPYGGGGTTGGSGSTSNQISGDANLRYKVGIGLTSATAKLSNASCAGMFSNLKNSAGARSPACFLRRVTRHRGGSTTASRF